ncbi:uncharacterized protein LOC129616010 [Condylostylus longicornis]|uniref:uncharacterized protein LOC129616010 n=1 Tax=Condylostylus longicornis TaxID=2530218 RepID=UPI00244DF52E|nr:uncharacterized protein LOC129616010 [Condylostylus longicornis]
MTRTTEEAEIRLQQTMRIVNTWMRQHGLELATAKTEIVMITKRRMRTIVPMQVGLDIVKTKSAAKYLGVILDTRLNFWQQIQSVSEKAANTINRLSMLMANVGGPGPHKRRLIMTAAQSVLLYGAEIWADTLRVEKY